MNSICIQFLPLLLSIFILRAQAEGGIYEKCLELSPQEVGIDSDEYFTSEHQLTRDKVTSAMHFSAFKVCQNADDDVIGLQFMVSSNEYGTPFSESEDESLDPIGTMSGTCQDMLLSGPIDRIRASPASNDGIAGIRFYRNGKAKTFGTIFDRTD